MPQREGDGGAQRVDWFLREWLAHLGKKQSDLVNGLSWDAPRVSKLVNGVQGFNRDDIFPVAKFLGIEPFELLLPPVRAEAIRNLRSAAAMIVAEAPAPYVHGPPAGAPRRRAGRGP